MPTLTYANGWESGIPFSTNGGGAYALVLGSWSLDTGTVKTGTYSAKAAVTASAACDIRAKTIATSAVFVTRFSVRFNTLPGGSVIVDLAGVATSPATSFPVFSYNPSTGFFCIRVGTAGKQEDNVTVAANTWYEIDFKAEVTGGNMVVNAKVDGRALTQASVATTATSFTSPVLGTVRTDHAVNWEVFYDNWVYGTTGADYPFGTMAIEALIPSSDGTHNAGTNVMEDNAGVDIGVVNAYDKINSIPPNTSNYIRQSTAGASNYVEVLFSNLATAHSSIVGAQAWLSYTSVTTTANRGACMVSKDGFSTFTAVWGDNTTTADYSDGSTANLFYKSAIVSGVVNDTTANALTARLGYSGDASPNPYWIDLIVEVVYVPTSSTPLTIANASHAHTEGNLALVQHNILAVQSASHSHSAGNLALVQHNLLTISNASHVHSSGNLTLGQTLSLIIASCLHEHTAQDTALTQHNILSLQDSSHTHTVGSLVLTALVTLIISNVHHAHYMPHVGWFDGYICSKCTQLLLLLTPPTHRRR